VCGIIADCPYSSPEAIIKRVIASRGLSCAAYRAVSLCATVVGGFRLGASSAVSAVRKTEIPILLIHGEDDDFVPSDMSREIQAAGKNISLFTVPGAKHGQCFAVAKELFVQRVLAFTDAHTPKNGETK
jgi:pimeloyl-ACP methyl ester carboxylesterase